MNRKFRGKRVDNGKWVEGSYDNCYPLCNGDYIIRHETQKIFGKKCDIFDPIEVVPETVGQYTGLKDKNVKEIYEGDLCRIYSRYHDMFAEGSAEVIFSYAYAGGWVLTVDGGEHTCNIGTRTKDIEIIGNIHEEEESK